MVLTNPVTQKPAVPRAGKSRPLPGTAISLISLVVIMAAWFISTNSGLLGPKQLPTPQALVGRFLELVNTGYEGSSLLDHISISLTRTLSGFVIGSILGITVGLAAGYNRVFSATISPVMSFIRPIPPIAFIPMAVLYFGLGETGKVILIAVTSFNYTVVNAQSGAAGVPIAYRRAAATLGVTRPQEFFRVIVPAALPSIFTGLKVALALSWAVVVAAELVGAQKGLGFMINQAALFFDIPTVFIGIILIGIIGLALNLALSFLENKLVHWRGRG